MFRTCHSDVILALGRQLVKWEYASACRNDQDGRSGNAKLVST